MTWRAHFGGRLIWARLSASMVLAASVMLETTSAAPADQRVGPETRVLREGSLVVNLDKGKSPSDAWGLVVSNQSDGTTKRIAMTGLAATTVPSIASTSLDRTSQRLSLLCRINAGDLAIVVDLKSGRQLVTFPAYSLTSSPDGRFLAFVEFFPRGTKPATDVYRVLDVRALRAEPAATDDPTVATSIGTVVAPSFSDSAASTKLDVRSELFWLDNTSIAFAAYDWSRDTSQILVVRQIAGQFSTAVVGLDANALARESPTNQSPAQSLRIKNIKRLSDEPLRLRVTFRDDYLLNAKMLDVSVP